MSIKVRYFASLKESLGCSEDQIDYVDSLTVREVWHCVNPGQALPENVLAAVNMDYVDFEHIVQDGDEVAFFPPVTGG